VPALAARHPAGPPATLAGPALVRVRETGAPLVSDDAASDPRLGETGPAIAAAGIRSLLVVPLAVAGQVLAAVQLEAVGAARRFSPAEVELAQTLANQAAVAAQNAGLYAETQQFAQELEGRVAARTSELERERRRVETLLQVTTELSSSLDLDLVLTRALQLVTDAVGAARASIFMLDLMTDQLIYRATLGGQNPVPPGGVPTRFRRYDGLIGYVVKNRKPVVIGDLSRELRWLDLPDHTDRYLSAMIAPLMAGEDALGAIVMLSPRPNAFEARQLQLVAAAANQVGAAINNAELYRLIRDQAERLGAMLRHQQVEATQSRAILEGIADGVLVADAGGDVILFNLACERLLGLQRDEVIRRPLTSLVGIYGPAGKLWIDAIDRWRRDPDSYQPGEFVAQRIEPDDQHVISVHMAPVIANDDYLGSVSVIRDITREVEVDRLKSEFVTNVSHELRTPMTSIKGYADLLILGAGGPLAPTQQRFLEVIKGNADRLSLLVNDLLDISRIESGKVELVMRATPVAAVLQDVAATVRGHMDEAQKPMQLVVEAGASLPPVWADRERITQIVMNLAENAFNYTAAGGSITLRAALSAGGREVVVEVVDSGLGIRPEDQPRLFDRFYRGEEALVMAASGTGLGLSIARQLAEMHGGRLWLKASEPGRGSTFALALPVAQAAQPEPSPGG
jgi:PAS domain S-box-containing protein